MQGNSFDAKLLDFEPKNSEKFTFNERLKSHFANDIEPFWKKVQNEPGV